MGSIDRKEFVMQPSSSLLTKDNFVNSSWKEIVDSSEKKECSSYWTGFWNKAKEASEGGDTANEQIFKLLAMVSHARISRETIDNCFPASVDNLTDVVSEILNPELQARVADILWVKRRDYKMAQLAVDAYLQSATMLESPQHWSPCLDRIRRAFYLSCKINYHKLEVIDHIEAVLDRYNGGDPLWLSARLMQMLQDAGIGSPAKYIALSEKAALSAEVNRKWDKARCLWNIKALWHRMANERENEFAASMLANETFVKKAEESLQLETPLYSLASRHLQQAVAGFRSIRGTSEETVDAKSRAEEVHRLLLVYQERSINELIPMSEEMDITHFVLQAKDSVRGKTLKDALFALAALNAPTNKARLREQVRQHASEFILSEMFPLLIQNSMGKVVATQPGSINSSNPEEAEKATLFKMYSDAILYQSMTIQSFVEPTREQINLEHNVSIRDILLLITPSLFIPPGREYVFAKGIHAGLTGDFLTSTHVLIPQIENSIRYIMWQRGIITSGLDDRGVQNEHNLNATLYRDEINSIFDENTLFDLRGVLVEHSGSNLRNRMAHGLIEDHEFYSSPIVRYFWWMTLRICYLSVLKPHQEGNEASTSENSIQ
jgi:hypothetical protein